METDMTATTIKKTTHLIDSIIKTADNRFKQYGYKKTTVNEIAADLGISKKTLYEVFSSKEEIIRETAWRETVEVMRLFSDTTPRKIEVDRLLLALCRFIFTDRIKRGKKGLFWGLYSGDTVIREAYLRALRRVVAALYEDGARRGLFKQANEEFAAVIIVGLITSATDFFPLVEQPVRIFDHALRMIADAIAQKDRIDFDAMG